MRLHVVVVDWPMLGILVAFTLVFYYVLYRLSK